MKTAELSEEIQVNSGGKVVIPPDILDALNLKEGDRLVVRRVGDALLLEPRSAIEKRLRRRFRHIPRNVSLADELVAERRAEAAREVEE